MSAVAAAPKVLIDCAVPLRWRDLDALNHVNNGAFLTFIEEARLQWFGQLDGPWFGDAWMPVVAAIHVNYRAQLAWPGNIRVQLFCERLGNTSLTVAHRIVDATDAAKLYSDGNTVLVWVNPADGKIGRIAGGGAEGVRVAPFHSVIPANAGIQFLLS